MTGQKEADVSQKATKSDDTQDKKVAPDADDSRVELLDDEGDLSPAFTKALEEIFLRFSQIAQVYIKANGSNNDQTAGGEQFKGAEKSVIMTDKELDAFTRVVNQGQILDEANKREMKEYLDVDQDGNLTYTGFCEMYHLQSGGDEDETWKDLKALGYNEQLQLIEGKAKT